MPRRLALAALAVCVMALAADAQNPQQGQSQGALGTRPGTGRVPEFPVPSITEYRPRSTLVVPEHPVKRAKFPVVDIHSHQPAPISPEQFDTVVSGMDSLNLRVLVNASGASG